jgi:hypothetical protein
MDDNEEPSCGMSGDKSPVWGSQVGIKMAETSVVTLFE